MITYADVERLLDVRAAERSVLSLYLRVSSDPAHLRELPARAHGMITLAAGNRDGRQGAESAADAWWPSDAEQQARKLLEIHGRDWRGHTAAIFVCGRDGLCEAFSLPCPLPDRAVLAERPHVRPLLTALQRCPAHYAVIVDRRHAWLFRVTGEQVEATTATTDAGEDPGTGGSGWHGLDSNGVNDLVMNLAHGQFHATIGLIERSMRPGGQEPLVIGGQEETIGQFAGLLPAGLRDRLAGTFVVDPPAMTPARVRELAEPVIASFVGMHEQRLAVEMREGAGPHDPLTVSGLNSCLAAVNRRSVQLLVVPVGGVTGGYVCEQCGELGTAGTACPEGLAESRWVPDLFEEMVTRTIDDGGRTETLASPPGDVAAQLRFPVNQSNGR